MISISFFHNRRICSIFALVLLLAFLDAATSFTSNPLLPPKLQQQQQSTITSSFVTTGTNQEKNTARPQSSILLRAESESGVSTAPAPVLDGKRILPFKIMRAGLKGHKVAAVYALLNSDYKKGSEGWENVEYVGVTMDLDASLQEDGSKFDSSKMAHVRALSFAIPSTTAMDDWKKKWTNLASDAGGNVLRPEDFLFDEDDDDDDDWDPEMMAAASAAASAAMGNNNPTEVVSPFASGGATTEGGEELSLTMENVDKVLDEVRPYLIADGGNVAVEDVNTEEGKVFLKLEGACGSCASSTVTMSMGIERVLKENFSTFKEVVQVEDPELAGPSELTMEDVEEEFGRLYPAIVAMGGVARINSVDAELGVVNMMFRGSNKVRQGLELALLDLPFVNRIEFSMDDE